MEEEENIRLFVNLPQYPLRSLSRRQSGGL
jgi:hypothetical protein